MSASVKLKSRLPSIIKELDPTVETALRAGAEQIAEAAKARVPVDHGRLRDAIHVDRRGTRTFAVTAGNDDVFYGHMVEHGTTNTPPRPFLVPAVEVSIPGVLIEVRKALGRRL